MFNVIFEIADYSLIGIELQGIWRKRLIITRDVEPSPAKKIKLSAVVVVLYQSVFCRE